TTTTTVYTHGDDGGALDLASQRRESDAPSRVVGSSYANAGARAITSMAYLSQTVVLCEIRHEAFEVSIPIGPSVI
ncbi:Regulatory-associated protein of TOR 1, partial [Linum perenne]